MAGLDKSVNPMAAPFKTGKPFIFYLGVLRRWYVSF